MRLPHARDALAKWLVVCLAGVGLAALLPQGLGARVVARLAGVPSGLTVAHLIGLGVIALGWCLFVVHVLALRSVWSHDPASLALGIACFVSLVAAAMALVLGTVAILAWTIAASMGLHVGLCLRIDHIGPRRDRLTLTPRPTSPIAASPAPGTTSAQNHR